jgi:hypothetical protein
MLRPKFHILVTVRVEGVFGPGACAKNQTPFGVSLQLIVTDAACQNALLFRECMNLWWVDRDSIELACSSVVQSMLNLRRASGTLIARFSVFPPRLEER